jgi:2-aminoadipate transaminase
MLPSSLSAKAKRTGEQPISHLMLEAVTNPSLISLAAGLVDQGSLPTDLMGELMAEILGAGSSGQAALQYGTTPGDAGLRDELLRHWEKLEGRSRESLGVGVDDVLVTTGSQQGLYLLCEAMIDPGDIVIAAAPSYFVFTGTLSSFGADIRTVPMDEGGMRVDLLEELLEELRGSGEIERLRAIYVVSYFQNPTGINLAANRRERILELARTFSEAHRIIVIEDAAYRELRYDGPDLPSIKSYDSGNAQVVLAMTFSKVFSPGMKTGYLVLPKALSEPVLHLKGNHDFGSSNLNQHCLRMLMRSGRFGAQVERLRETYRVKRDVMLEALDAGLGNVLEVHWTRPAGGLYSWLTLPEGVSTRRGDRLFQRCIDAGVLYVPGDYCFAPQQGRDLPTNHMRLSFGVVEAAPIREGIQRLSRAIREEMGLSA